MMTRREFERDPRGYALVGLYEPKTPVNIGAAVRAAGCYGAKSVYVQGERFGKYEKFCTDAMKAHRRIPLIQVPSLLSIVPHDCVLVAVEIVEGARCLFDYVHPRSAFYIFGPEDGSVPGGILTQCRDTVYVPTDGPMNLAATVNVVLYDRAAKTARDK